VGLDDLIIVGEAVSSLQINVSIQEKIEPGAEPCDPDLIG